MHTTVQQIIPQTVTEIDDPSIWTIYSIHSIKLHASKEMESLQERNEHGILHISPNVHSRNPDLSSCEAQ
jgi:hypothetical protein